MITGVRKSVWDALADSLDVSDQLYEAAKSRYQDIGDWLNDSSISNCAQYEPRVSPQGSFRIGTVAKAWKREHHDLDLFCNLQSGVTSENSSQESLKQLVGADLEAYRTARGIRDELEEKQRCWRLNYRDAFRFHIDTVPSLPHTAATRLQLREMMIKAGTAAVLAEDLSALALAITDNRHPQYRLLNSSWNISNPEGYAKWFESRMRQSEVLLKSRAIELKVASVDTLPVYRWKTPLQRAVQILKRHRDVMFEDNPDRKPISIIITTLAATAYEGETDLQTALDHILSTMGSFVSAGRPRVPNPVNPQEDFADKWGDSRYAELRLEQNFKNWLAQAKADFEHITGTEDAVSLGEQAQKKFAAVLDDGSVASNAGASVANVLARPVHNIRVAPKPWAL